MHITRLCCHESCHQNVCGRPTQVGAEDPIVAPKRGEGLAANPNPKGAPSVRVCTLPKPTNIKNNIITQHKQEKNQPSRKRARHEVMASAVDPSWVDEHLRPENHASSAANLKAQMPAAGDRHLRREISIFEKQVPVIQPQGTSKWSMDSYEPPPFQPPWTSKAERVAMCAESDQSNPEGPLGSMASEWVDDLFKWYERLQAHFRFDKSNVAANVTRSEVRWRRRLQFLKHQHLDRFRFIMDFIRNGHLVPFEKEPPRYFRKRNPPSLQADKARAWVAIKKDIAHGAISPVDVVNDGIPWCVCPVRTADKNDGTAHFVHNTRHVNNGIAKEGAHRMRTGVAIAHA